MLIAVYLNDHLAGATGMVELAGRSAGANRGNRYGATLEQLRAEIAEDRAALLQIMSTLGVGEDRLKTTAARVAEKLGRLKLNGRIFGYSPYSRVVEFEVLLLGMRGKLALWQSLTALQAREPRLDAARLEGLTARAEDQLGRVEEARRDAVADAFGPTD